MKKNLLKLLVGLLIFGTFSQMNAQDVITFDVNSKKQLVKSLETWSEVIMYHPTMCPTPSDLVIDLNSHNFTMSLKQDIELVNDNADPYTTDFTKIDMNMGGRSGIKMSSYFPYIREYKRLRDSMRVVNPALKPFALNLRPGYFDRYIPAWIKSTATGTAFIDSTKYAEYAEQIYAQCKLYKDNTGVDVAYIDPLILKPGDAITGNAITQSNLCKLIGTLGTYLEDRGFTPALSIGAGLRLTEKSSSINQALLINYITAVFNDPISKKYVKNVNVDYDLAYGSASNAFFNQVDNLSLQYGFEITTELSYSSSQSKTWNWAGNGMKWASNLSKMINTAKANKVMLVYHSNFETAFTACLVFDSIGNGGASLDDPRRKSTAIKTEVFYMLRHLFKHTNPGSTYALTSTSTNTNIATTVVYDTITHKSTIFLVNNGTSSYTAKLSYGSYNPGTYDVYRCSATEIDARQAPVNGTDNIILPPRSATILTNDHIDGKINQTITFGSLPTKKLGDPVFTLSATASSGLPVTYSSSNPLVATIVGDVVTIAGTGTTTITASQAGSAEYFAATNTSQVLTIEVSGTGITAVSTDFSISVFPNPAKDKINIDLGYVSNEKTNILLTDLTGKVIYKNEFSTVSKMFIPTMGISKGIYLLTVSNGLKLANKKICIE